MSSRWRGSIIIRSQQSSVPQMDLQGTLSLVVMIVRLIKTQFHLYEKLQLSLVKLVMR
eukprot:COSAG01_NODE_1395_length_10476_cov_11.562331_16_plen_57_part_01